MNASSGLYPSLGRYFKTRVRECLDGKKTFTRAEKKAISANIAMKLMHSKRFDYQDLEDAHAAWSGEFDEIFKKG